MYSKISIYSYSSTLETICVVPAPRFNGVILTNGKPSAVSYPTNNYYQQKDREYKDLKGLNIEDYDRLKPALVVYELGNGALLAATPAVFEKATSGSNNAYSKGSACFVHQVSDLELLEELPINLKCGVPGLPAFQF